MLLLIPPYLKTSEINGSRTFEDIIVHDSATVLYETSSTVGTGGHTDKWIRLLLQES